jgi:hypothetical protein
MAVKSLHQLFYYLSKYLNSVKCQKIVWVHLNAQISVDFRLVEFGQVIFK